MRAARFMSFSRNMVVVREGERLVVLNSMRLGEAGLEQLDRLGKVTDVVRLAGFHGVDDPFYKDRYDATVWGLQGMYYQQGFDPPTEGGNNYFKLDRFLTPDELPLSGASLHTLDTTPPDALLHLDREGGILITGDSLQNWGSADRYFSLLGRVMMKRWGFLRPHQLGPGWIKATKPATEQIRGLLDLDFEHLLPAHGTAVVGGAKEHYRPALERYEQRK